MFLKMTNFLCLFSVSVIVVSGNDDIWSIKTTRNGMESYNNCVNVLNIPVDDIIKIEKIDDPLNRRILKCVYIDMGYYTEGKGFHTDRMVKQLGGGDGIEAIVRKCVPSDSNEPADVQIVEVEECFKMEKVGGYQD